MLMTDHSGTPMQAGRAAVNGTTLHYRTAGTGPAVVLLHGVPKTGYHWRFLVPELAAANTVVVPDLRGLGDSDHPADGFDSANMADDIAELMRDLGHERYAVVGEDWGSAIGYQLAARHRDAVTGLVFTEALLPGFGFEEFSFLNTQNAAGMFLWHLPFYFKADVPEMLISGHERELITFMLKDERLFPDTATPEVVDEYVRCYTMPGGIRSMLAIYRAMLVDAEQNREAAKRPLEIPVLTIGGASFIGDRNEAVMRLLAGNVRGHVLDAGHDLAEEAPHEFAALVTPFLAGLQEPTDASS